MARCDLAGTLVHEAHVRVAAPLRVIGHLKDGAVRADHHREVGAGREGFAHERRAREDEREEAALPHARARAVAQPQEVVAATEERGERVCVEECLHAHEALPRARLVQARLGDGHKQHLKRAGGGCGRGG